MENILEVINKYESVDYSDYGFRSVAKAIILNNESKMVSFKKNHYLIGGGIEAGESIEQALRRECLEELGVTIDIIQPLGTVIQYRDALKKKYEVHAFITKLVSFQEKPTTTQADEINLEYQWTTLQESRDFLENKIYDLENNESIDKSDDHYQGSLYNAKTHLIFIKKAKEILNL